MIRHRREKPKWHDERMEKAMFDEWFHRVAFEDNFLKKLIRDIFSPTKGPNTDIGGCYGPSNAYHRVFAFLPRYGRSKTEEEKKKDRA